MKKILVTGGAGFIGYHLSKHLLNDPNNEVVIVDNLQRGRYDEDFQNLLRAYPDRVSFLKLDLTEHTTYPQLTTDFDQIYHLAAVNGTKHFYNVPHEVLRTDILAHFYLLDWIATLSKKPKVCFTSSCETYAGALEAFGNLPLPTPENVPLVIPDVFNPRWSYAGTKAIGEQATIFYAKHYGFPAVIVRPHNFYGPREGYDHVIPEFLTRIHAKHDSFPMFGADQTRNFCYIDDAVVAMQQLMDSPLTDGSIPEIVNIGSMEETTIGDLAEMLFHINEWRPSSIQDQGAPKGSVRRRLADNTKIKNMVGWQPTTSLQEGLKRTHEWYRTHPNPEA